MNFIYLTSRDGILLKLLIDSNELRDDLSLDILSNKKNIELEQRALPYQTTYFNNESELDILLTQIKPDLVLSAGYNKILSSAFVRKYDGILTNIHPSLTAGYNPQIATLRKKDKWTGNLLHYIDEGVDTGEIIAKSKIRVLPNDSYENLNMRLRKNSLPMIIDMINNWERYKRMK